MNIYQRYFKTLFFGKRFYYIFSALIALFIFSYYSSLLFFIARLSIIIFFLITLVDYIALFYKKEGITAQRLLPERFSNGDDNRVDIVMANHYSFRASVKIIDEVPVQFQKRDFLMRAVLFAEGQQTVTYHLKPVQRGEYTFFDLNVFVKTPLQLVVRRYVIPSQKTIKVYPSYFSLRKFDLMSHSNSLTESGRKKIRKIGQSVEFEQIREYVNGDDIRTLNWKATARKGGQLMVNSYIDERSQQIYCVIDKGRVMKMPFENMTLLDYSINAALILSRVALLKQDRAGLITFGDNIGQVLPADKKAGQMNNILETLYDQKTNFGESDFEKLHALIRTRITQRSLIVLFTNFESMSALQRQLPYIRGIARSHLVLVVFFENTELRTLSEARVNDIETLYTRTIAEKFVHEKRLMVKEFQQHGIFTILTAPQQLTVNTVNKYLELKARQAI